MSMCRMCRALLACLVFVLIAAPGVAQDYPARRIDIIVPFGAGGTADIVARVVAERLSQQLSTPVVVSNRAGGNTIIGVDAVAKSQPDGYTLLVGSTSMTVNAALGRPTPYDLFRDLAPVGLLIDAPNVLVTRVDGVYATIQDFVRAAKAASTPLAYGSLGPESLPNMQMRLLMRSTGLSLTEVPYNGSPAAILDVLGGRIEVTFTGLVNSQPQISAGKIRALAITSATRTPLLPEVPTLAETVAPGYSSGSWYGLLARSGTPQAIITRLADEVRGIMAERAVTEMLSKQGADIVFKGPADFDAFLRKEVAQWAVFAK